jgi:hypothetical protein
MSDFLINSTPRDIILSSTIRYGVSRNVDARDKAHRPVKLAMVVMERDNGSFEVFGIREDRIRFYGEGVIQAEVLRKAYG